MHGMTDCPLVSASPILGFIIGINETVGGACSEYCSCTSELHKMEIKAGRGYREMKAIWT